MKKLSVIWIVVVMVITGCSGSDLGTYQKAIEETARFDQGEMSLKLDMKMSFNEEGMSLEEQREISYYETMNFHMDSRYDERDGGFMMIADTYYNFGGIGFDTTMYMDDDSTLIELPIVEKFVSIDTQSVNKQDSSNASDQEIFEQIKAKWNEILDEEDVFSGKKAYVMTDKGQIKTTTYTLNINSGQFELLKKALLEIIKEEGVIEGLMAQSYGYDKEAVAISDLQSSIEETLNDLSLVDFKGEAFVDFDGRLVQEVLKVNLEGQGSGKGDIQTMEIVYQINYDNLGKDLGIEIPKLDEADILDIENMEDIDSLLPKGLF